ncbi:hypothetical protein LA76x_2219 [Lysobacter antibioticus]|uniref:Uncharacterized protein n=1 Tax=Lysobacter antibioticus TaxID=84531 RepID=A0A0S2F9X1_LYSAN|nr:hypothetical protein LA76x_2219 [Lysobacter antibioticus]
MNRACAAASLSAHPHRAIRASLAFNAVREKPATKAAFGTLRAALGELDR